MNLVVLNGSPKGDVSVTMQYIHYLEKHFPSHHFVIVNVAQRINKIAKDERAFDDVIKEVRTADIVVWAFPLYVCLVPAQYKRFIELIFERKAEDAFREKYSAILTTSVHFYDHTAHNYMTAICNDLGMRCAASYSAGMYDLLKGKGREKFVLFAEDLFNAVEKQLPATRTHPALHLTEFIYTAEKPPVRLPLGGKRMLILVDDNVPSQNLAAMVARFVDMIDGDVEVAHLESIDIKGGCIGCLHCGYDNACAYEGKDGFIDFYNQKVRSADMIVFAGTIRDRFLSARWKTYFDRAFFNTHIPTLIGKQIGFLISGPLMQIPNLREILAAYCEWQQTNLVDIVTDEYGDSAIIDSLIQGLAERLIWSAGKGYLKPMTFRGVAGMKIFRDEVWGNLRFVFQADHRYYRRHGFYDFPQKNFKTRRLNFLMILLTKIPSFRKVFVKKINDEMIKPLQYVVNNK
jgi:multimeric flavodoxin WrbA